MSQSYAKSAGNILNPLHTAKALDARAVNAYGSHLATLCTAALNIAGDIRSKRLAAVVALARLSELHRDYTRVCCEIAMAVASAARRELHIAWDEIRENTNSNSARLEDLCRQVRESQGGNGPAPYFQSVPLTTTAVLEVTADIFADQKPSNAEEAVLEISEKVAERPLLRADATEYVGDMFKLATAEASSLIDLCKSTAIIDEESSV